MIDIQKDTPIEYSKQSRDYQVFSFLYSALFNQVKLFADQIENIWTDNIDDKLLLPRSYTLNFIPKYDWDNDDLRGVTNNFRYLLRTKGTADAIKACLEILARLHNASIQGIDIEIIGPGHIRIIIGEEISDFGIIEDLLRYILPAGITYEVVKYANVNSTLPPTAILVNSKFEELTTYDNSELYIPHFSTFGTYPTGGSNEQYAIPYTATSERPYMKNARFGPGMIITDGEDAGLEIYIAGKQVTSGYNGQIQFVKGYDVVANKSNFDPALLYYKGGRDDEASGTNVGMYYMKLDESDFIYDSENPNTEYSIIIDNGYLRITGGSLRINIAGNTIIIPYDGQLHTADVDWEVESTIPSEGLFDPSRLVARVSGTVSATDVGTYPFGIQKSDFSYRDHKVDRLDIVVKDGYIQITPRDVKVVINGNSEELVYDGKDHTVKGYDISFTDTVYKEDFIHFSGTSEDSEASGKNVGTYYMSLPGKFSNTSDNFNVEFDVYNGFLKITPKDVTVTANNSEKTYGDNDPTFTAEVVGIIDSEDDSEHSLISYTIRRDSEDIQDVDTYQIIPEGSSEQGNYKVTFIPGILTINPADLLIWTDSEEKVYDGLPANRGTFNVSGLKYNDGIEGSLTSEEFINAGDYTNEIEEWHFNSETKSTNYNPPVIREGQIKIKKASAITITIDSESKPYDSTPFIITPDIQGVVAADELEVTIDSESTTMINAGSHTPVVSYNFIKGLESNYEDVILDIGELTINKATGFKIVVSGQTKVYDKQPLENVTYIIEGSTAGTDILNVTIDSESAKNVNVGTYAIDVDYEFEKGLASNYEFITVEKGDLVITPKDATITCDSESKIFGDPDPTLTGTVTGLIDSEDVAVTYVRTAGEDAGEYTISANHTDNSNYNIQITENTFTIKKRNVTIKPDNLTTTVGNPIGLTFTAEGEVAPYFINVTLEVAEPTFDWDTPGVYTIRVANYTGSDNYIVDATQTGTLTIA